MGVNVATTTTGICGAVAQLMLDYTAETNVGDTAGNRGQCVGLIEVWLDSLGLPHIWGNAKDLLANADPRHYGVIENGPTNYPSVGDIAVWGSMWGNGNGHCGVVVAGDVNRMLVFEQNDPDGSPPHEAYYSYFGVKGWLHPVLS